MARTRFGALIPIGAAGAVIELAGRTLVVGRKPDCDVVLNHHNVSGHHCRLTLEHGYWHVEDLGSTNGTKINHHRIHESRLMPGDRISFAKHTYEIRYDPQQLGAEGSLPEPDA